jgi:hypothetical protein
MKAGPRTKITGATAAIVAALSSLAYFTPEEFKQKNDVNGSTELYFDTTTAQMLDSARYFARVPFKLNSAVRLPDYNESVGGAKLSSHTAPCYCAVDIRTGNKFREERILYGLKKAGFIRIIIYPRHIHADTDSSKTKWGVWHSNYN